ncbi:TPA: methyltransferase domain-containing protein [Legionella pneumophila]|nr:methyltransferase domain-containing protein [Legionella pneumophila]HDS3863199.1 methyltransferase domain-containing protein [Legionella pneumophila]
MYNSSTDHSKKNQENYNHLAVKHNELALDSTLYLAYRDIPSLLDKYLFSNSGTKTIYKMLDYGCGAGLSTSLVENMFLHAGYKVETCGIDINQENIQFAKNRLPHVQFSQIAPNQSLNHLGKFDLIVCNFVLVELKEHEMDLVLKNIELLLSSSGIALITNCSSKVYKTNNNWYTLNNKFQENTAIGTENPDKKFIEDQPIKLEVFSENQSNISFTFFDFFHSGSTYKQKYIANGLDLKTTHKPLGLTSDNKKWKSEMEYSPYKIHVLSKKFDENKLDLGW